MVQADYTTAFKKDLKRAQRSGQDIEKMKSIISKLIAQQPLEPKHRDHVLRGNFIGYRECHITPDWLLIYKASNTEILFTRLGSHSELFG